MNTIRKIRSRLGIARRNYKRSKEPAGIGYSFLSDIKTRLPQLDTKTIFDVGANIGVVALTMADAFPEAQVHAFEPGTRNFAGMVTVLAGRPDVQRHNLALSDTPGQLRLLIEPEHPTMARLSETDSGPSETVVVDTIDRFCVTNNIDSVEIVKIDTEGHEMGVIRGARLMLEQGRIALLKLECTTDIENTFHTQFSDIYDYLRPFGYKLFGIYDQSENPIAPSPALQRFDAAFVSPSAILSGRS